MFDLDAYLQRIGLDGRPTIEQLHRAHATSIPFENLDPHCGIPISLESQSIQRKLVERRRGGYCFEQNLLLKEAFEALGAEVELFLARVRINAEGHIRPRGHLVMRVDLEGASWHADVGFGLGGLFDPLPFGPGQVYEQCGWRFRVVQDGPELVLQTVDGEQWVDLYGFIPQPVPFIDLETSNWWVCTHPDSPFVTGLVASAQNEHGVRVSLSDWGELVLTERTPDAQTITPVLREQVPALLASHFGLAGFSLAENGRLHPAAVG